MMNSYDVAHGLSQVHPGPEEPVELAQQPGAAPATGNTARDQEMYVAGIRTGEENTKHNAAIRAGVPSGWKLVPIEPTDAMLDAGIKQHRCEQGDPWYSSPDLGEGDCRDIYAAMLNAAPAAPGVSRVEDAQDGVTVLPDGSACALASFPLPATHWLYAEREYAPGAEEPKDLPAPILTHAQRDAVVASIRYAVRGATMCGKEQDFDPDALVQNAVYALCGPYGPTVAAPAAGDARDAERLDWLQQHDGRFFNKDRISSIVGVGFLVAGDPHGVRHPTVRAAIDAALAASQQQEG
ncbi:hypothetical protein [Achromobacter dolens]|uniref:hypothetical protein n=1 Tax=Achromobacter dolens TaxID=1287738 RepID=UPI000E32182C|nr:hypothetical protein [Achromobacter dolens]